MPAPMLVFDSKPWSGPDKIVIGIDIGTTNSAVSFACLHEKTPPSVRRVDQWPACPKGITKIPSVLLYNEKNEIVCGGAEAARMRQSGDAQRQNLCVVEEFKLNLHPHELLYKDDIAVEGLPKDLEIVEVYSWWIKFLLETTKTFFTKSITNGTQTWETLFETLELVFACPNAWGPKQHQVIRQAVIAAKILDEDGADRRLSFVTEGEASLNFCLTRDDVRQALQEGTKLIVCDAGGSTVDTSSYIVKSCKPELVLKEAKAPGCVQAGGAFVSFAAREYFRDLLQSVSNDTSRVNALVNAAVADFDANVKHLFTPEDKKKFFTISLSEPNFSFARLIEKGAIKVKKEQITAFFETSITQIMATIKRQSYRFNPEHLFLVGGYGDSPLLQNRISGGDKGAKCQVTVLNEGGGKAVSDGAVIWKCTRHVRERVARRSYGMTIATTFDPENVDHMGRKTSLWLDDVVRVEDYFRCFVVKDTSIKEDVVVNFMRQFNSPDTAMKELTHYQLKLYSFEGTEPPPFVKDIVGKLLQGFEEVCTISADLSEIVEASSLATLGKEDKQFFKVTFGVGLTLGQTELRAYIQWKDKGQVKQSNAAIIADSLA